MARIRTVKPEFWTDEKIVRLPFEVRLLFIGLWNFCDDEGYLYDEPDRIRLEVFPNDDVDTEGSLDLLVSAELLDRVWLSSGKLALRVTHFEDHQRVSHPSASKIAPEVSGKLAIPQAVRRELATKYGCPPGGEASAQCYYCKAEGVIHWPKTSRGKPGYWVAFSGLHVDHFEAESQGGETVCDNLVLACPLCNRSKNERDGYAHLMSKLQSPPEPSRALRPEGKGIEGNRREGKGIEGETGRDVLDSLLSKNSCATYTPSAGEVLEICGLLFHVGPKPAFPKRMSSERNDRDLLRKIGWLLLVGQLKKGPLIEILGLMAARRSPPKRPGGYLRAALANHLVPGDKDAGMRALNRMLATAKLPAELERPPPK